MKKIYILGVLMLLIVALIPVQTRAQNSVTLTFTCQTTYGGYLQPDSITIVNLTRNWTETIYYPDTVYTLNVETSVPNHPNDNGMQVMPNPFNGSTRIRIQSPKTENMKITLTDMGGRVCAEYNGLLQKGVNQFSVSLSIPQTYVLTVRSSSGIRSLKMENVGHSGSNSILYEREANINKPMVQLKSSSNHPFELGDEMRYQGFTTIHSTPMQSQEVTHAQNANETIVLVFPSTVQLPTVTTATASNISTTTATCGGNVTADGDAIVTARGVCWSTSQNPTISDSYTIDGDGTGSFTSNLTGLTAGTTYYVRAYATNSEGTAYGQEVSFTTAMDTFTCGTDTVVDYDGNVYTTVQIGQQCWMAENLRTTHYSNGTAIVNGSGESSSTVAYYYPLGDPYYGNLYNWKAVMGESSSSVATPSGVQGICPDGWHVPSDDEWTQLTNYVSGHSQYLCSNNIEQIPEYIAKALASDTGWNSSSNECAVGNTQSNNNVTGFGVLPTGYYSYSSYGNGGYDAYLWSASEASSGDAWYRNLCYNYAYVKRNISFKSRGYSVRCIRDELDTSVELPVITTSSVSNISATTVTCGGNVTSDGGATVIARGVCYSTSQNPTINDSHTMEGSGIGSFTSNLTNLTASTTYYVRAYATNSEGTAYGQQRIFTSAEEDFLCGNSTITDYDGNVYTTVQIGQQCWIAENLHTAHYSNGTAVSYLYAGGDASNANIYGYLYNWSAVMNGSTTSNTNPSAVQGVCPNGWHVPSDAEWTQLTDYASSQSQYLCSNNTVSIAKALASTSGWVTSYDQCSVGNPQNSNNATGFGALPVGHYYSGNYVSFGYNTFFWSTTKYSDYSDAVWCRLLDYRYSDVGRDAASSNSMLLSVRCLRDETSSGSTTVTQPAVITNAVSNNTGTSVTCGGNVTFDGGATVTVRGVCYSTSQNPTISDTHTADGSGIGNFFSYITGLTTGTTYYVRAYATNSMGTAYGQEVSFTTEADTFTCGTDTVVDYDGNVYSTVQIGMQCWMAENLRTSHYSNGTAIALSSSSSSTVPRRYNPDGNASNVSTYGYLYNWSAVMNGSATSNTNPSEVQGICPNSWHVPSDAEWTQLTDYVSSQSQYLCSNNTEYIAKALASTMGWYSYYLECTVGNMQSSNNATGFSALPAGELLSSYEYYGFGKEAAFWSTTENGVEAWGRGLYFEDAYVIRTCDTKSSAFSVRCLKN